MLIIKDKNTCGMILLSLCMLIYESLIYYQIPDLFKRITQIRTFNFFLTKSICENCIPFARAPLIFKALLKSFTVGLPLNIT